MYSTQAVSRPEITAYIEQAREAERFYIGTKILPVLGVKKRASRYPVIQLAKGGLMRRQQTKRSSSGRYNETPQEHEWDTYDCQDRGLEQRVDDSKAEEMDDFFSLEKVSASNVSRKCKLDFEVAAAALIMNASTFNAEDAAVEYTEANLATINVARDINDAIERVTSRGEMVNTIVFSSEVWNRIRRSPLLQQYVYGKLGEDAKNRAITPKSLSDVFEIDLEDKVNIHIARAKYDASNRGKSTANLQSIWTPDYIWVGCVKDGEIEKGGVGRTLVWEADVPDGLFATETYRDEGRRSDMVRVRTNSIEKVTNENCGELITTGYA